MTKMNVFVQGATSPVSQRRLVLQDHYCKSLVEHLHDGVSSSVHGL